ncbi:nicotinate-nucleotide adenylyltransferase [Advenella kashmirensis WT001]|uniref:Probable nicotinate-nucleotide adenylyltransferase n=1 Tax=Advenella kashmirensis (strain DSM 17095 / LMG 22695 / WT001) TaxID=1036672 RepID=I3UBD4_ADVKW|nr:nicotinate-nucleotide adenylyltransferase [Advenella kashmirensis]AFK62322.1 nicotinate-nucleotide adenylyltransferase [Advenella kashmirensis WT001]
MKKIGLLGGSFNPVHLAHLAMARTALHALNLDEVQLIPAGNPWQKQPLRISGAQRLEMLALAIADEPGIVINDIEINREGATYTIDTLRNLPRNAKYYWLLGTDQLNNFCTWQNWQEITDYVTLTVAWRTGYPLHIPQELDALLRRDGKGLITLPFKAMDVSSTEIRSRIQQGQDASAFVPAPVLDYINTHGLYR